MGSHSNNFCNSSTAAVRSGRAALVLTTALAPMAWGTTYLVTTELLPAGRPLLAGCLRALPAGVALAAFTRTRPTGAWWWKAAVLGVLNIGGFPPDLLARLLATSPDMVVATWEGGRLARCWPGPRVAKSSARDRHSGGAGGAAGRRSSEVGLRGSSRPKGRRRQWTRCEKGCA